MTSSVLAQRTEGTPFDGRPDTGAYARDHQARVLRPGNGSHDDEHGLFSLKTEGGACPPHAGQCE